MITTQLLIGIHLWLVVIVIKGGDLKILKKSTKN
jgi:hypothetical protein